MPDLDPALISSPRPRRRRRVWVAYSRTDRMRLIGTARSLAALIRLLEGLRTAQGARPDGRHPYPRIDCEGFALDEEGIGVYIKVVCFGPDGTRIAPRSRPE